LAGAVPDYISLDKSGLIVAGQRRKPQSYQQATGRTVIGETLAELSASSSHGKKHSPPFRPRSIHQAAGFIEALGAIWLSLPAVITTA